MAAPYAEAAVQAVAGIEARGFILGGAVADRLGCGFVPLRKKGKLPWKTIGQEYTLEYGVDIIEMHEDAVRQGERILIVDDLIATGGTAEAAVKLPEKENVTFFAGVPTMYWGLLNALTAGVDVERIARNMRRAVSGGSSLPVEIIREVKERFGVTILEGYGLSEPSPVATFSQAAHCLVAISSWRRMIRWKDIGGELLVVSC